MAEIETRPMSCNIDIYYAVMSDQMIKMYLIVNVRHVYKYGIFIFNQIYSIIRRKY